MVGDAAPSATAELANPRVRYENLTYNRPYPEDQYRKWIVARDHAVRPRGLLRAWAMDRVPRRRRRNSRLTTSNGCWPGRAKSGWSTYTAASASSHPMGTTSCSGSLRRGRTRLGSSRALPATALLPGVRAGPRLFLRARGLGADRADDAHRRSHGHGGRGQRGVLADHARGRAARLGQRARVRPGGLRRGSAGAAACCSVQRRADDRGAEMPATKSSWGA